MPANEAGFYSCIELILVITRLICVAAVLVIQSLPLPFVRHLSRLTLEFPCSSRVRSEADLARGTLRVGDSDGVSHPIQVTKAYRPNARLCTSFQVISVANTLATAVFD